MFAHFGHVLMKHFVYFATAKAISQIKYRAFKKERVTKGDFQLSLHGYFCSLSLKDLSVGSMHQGMTYVPPATVQTHSPLRTPCMCPSLLMPGADMNDTQLLTPKTPLCSCNSIQSSYSKDRPAHLQGIIGCPIMGMHSLKPKNIL